MTAEDQERARSCPGAVGAQGLHGTSGSTKRARSLLRCAALLVVGAIVSGAPSVAQEVDAPRASAGTGSVVAPSPWLGLVVPVQPRVDLKLYAFYIGELEIPSVQVDLPVRMTKFLTITPSYLYYSVPAAALNELANLPGAFSGSYDEHQFRIDGTVTFPIRKFEVSLRNMYVRRFRPAPADDANRYRGRIAISYPLPVNGRTLQPFASYEAYYDHHNGGWNKDRAWTGVTVPLTKHVFLQPSYLWESSDGLKTIHYVLLGLIFSAK